MWIDQIVSNEAKRKLVEKAIDELNSIGFFGALMEHSTYVNASQPLKAGALENYALRAAWFDGASDMLKNVYEFKERFVLPRREIESPKPQFGAVASMLQKKDFNSEAEFLEFSKISNKG